MRPDENTDLNMLHAGFPDYTWEDIYRFSEEEIKQFEEIIRSTAHLIIEFSQEGGFENASNLLEWENTGFISGQMRINLLNQSTYISKRKAFR